MSEILALGAGTDTPLYGGLEFTTGVEALTAVKDYLILQDWSVTTDNISTSGDLTLQGVTDNGHECWIRFSYHIEASREYLAIQGDLNGNGTTFSPELELNYNLGLPNRLWLMADKSAGGICVRDRHSYSGGISFGFYERFDENDQYAWGVAKANNRLNDAYVAKSKHNDQIWHQVGSSYQDADLFFLTTYTGPYQGVIDFLTAIPYFSSIALTILNAGYYSHQGRVNGVNELGLITRRFYVEGNGNPNQFTPNVNQDPGLLYARGYVKHFYNGFGELAGGAIFSDSKDNVYLAVGTDPEQGWQGLQVKKVDDDSTANAVTAISSDRQTVIYHGGTAGVKFSEKNNFFTEFKNVLTTLGWQIETDSINFNNGDRELVAKGRYRNSEEFCYLNLKYISVTNRLQFRGQVIESGNTYYSKIFEYPLLGTNKFWLTASSQAFAITLDNSQETVSLYFGFYSDRVEATDKYAWGIGLIQNDLDQLSVAKSYYDGLFWESIGDDFDYTLSEPSSYPSFGTSDRLTTALIPNSHYNNEDSSGNNSGVYAYNGQINGATGKNQLDYFAVVEGRAKRKYGAQSFGVQKPKALFYRGYIEFAAVGAGQSGKLEVLTSSTGAKFLSVGKDRCQAMQIG